jgi:glutathione S-transferase
MKTEESTAQLTGLPPLVLVSYPLCPYVQRAAIALQEKGAAFERVDIDLEHKPGWFLAISPLGKTPLLRVGDEVIFESAVICEYLEETLPGPLHPPAALDRARHRGFMELGSAILGDIWGLETATDRATFVRKRGEVIQKLRRVEEVLGAGPYFSGVSFSLVDAVFAPIFRYFEVFEAILGAPMLGELPRVGSWRRALAARPTVQRAVASDHAARLRAFLVAHEAYLLREEARSA